MGTSAPQMEQMKQNMKASWMAGDFGQIAKYTAAAADDFIERLHIKSGVDLLDVACGTGESSDPGGTAGSECSGRGYRAESVGTGPRPRGC